MALAPLLGQAGDRVMTMASEEDMHASSHPSPVTAHRYPRALVIGKTEEGKAWHSRASARCDLPEAHCRSGVTLST